MKTVSLLLVTVVAIGWLASPPADAQAPAALPTPGFHHLHLNSINPEAAIDFYTKQFPATSKGTFAGQPALRSPNNVWVLFNKVPAPPATQPQTAFWHFGWHVTDVHKSMQTFIDRGVTLLPLYVEEAGGTVVDGEGHIMTFNRELPTHRGVIAANAFLTGGLQGLWNEAMADRKQSRADS